MITVDIVAPLCAPTRFHVADRVRRQLAPYEFHHGQITAGHLMHEGKAVAWLVRVPFTNEAAEWGEYVLLRYGYQRSGEFINPQNEAWAQRYTLGSGAWHEESCKDKPQPGQTPVPLALRGETGNANPPRPWSSGSRGEAQHSKRRNERKTKRRSTRPFDALLRRLEEWL